MDNFEQQLRRHYDAQQLPADRVQALLAAGRAASAARRRVYWQMAAAAVLVLGGLWWGSSTFLRNHNSSPQIASEAVARSVAAYFAPMDYQLPLVSTDRNALVDWLKARGGPANFEVPPALARLSSYGCQVLDVEGRKVYLICFLLETPPPGAAAGDMPMKKTMMVATPDGQMMKKTVPLVHLVVADRRDFQASPAVGERVPAPLTGEWHYATWTRGDQVYVIAGAVPADRLAGLIQTL